jgi:hypothetical protein
VCFLYFKISKIPIFYKINYEFLFFSDSYCKFILQLKLRELFFILHLQTFKKFYQFNWIQFTHLKLLLEFKPMTYDSLSIQLNSILYFWKICPNQIFIFENICPTQLVQILNWNKLRWIKRLFSKVNSSVQHL